MGGQGTVTEQAVSVVTTSLRPAALTALRRTFLMLLRAEHALAGENVAFGPVSFWEVKIDTYVYSFKTLFPVFGGNKLSAN